MKEMKMTVAKKRHWLIPIFIVLTIGLLLTGWFLPTFVLTQAIFFTERYSIWMGIVELWKAQHYILSLIIFIFSMVFPLLKLLVLLGIWFDFFNAALKAGLLTWLEKLGKWSMLDVYVVSVLIVLIKVKDVVDANAEIGIYVFATAVIFSMILTHLVKKSVQPT